MFCVYARWVSVAAFLQTLERYVACTRVVICRSAEHLRLLYALLETRLDVIHQLRHFTGCFPLI